MDKTTVSKTIHLLADTGAICSEATPSSFEVKLNIPVLAIKPEFANKAEPIELTYGEEKRGRGVGKGKGQGKASSKAGEDFVETGAQQQFVRNWLLSDMCMIMRYSGNAGRTPPRLAGCRASRSKFLMIVCLL